jgi:hypothetical protein
VVVLSFFRSVGLCRDQERDVCHSRSAPGIPNSPMISTGIMGSTFSELHSRAFRFLPFS